MPLCLTPEELIEVTGKSQPAAKARALNKMGVDHIMRADGKVLVHRQVIEAALGVREKDRTPKEWKPRWEN